MATTKKAAAKKPAAKKAAAKPAAAKADAPAEAPASVRRAEQQGEPPVFGRDGDAKPENSTPVAAHESGATYADGTPVPEIVDASTAAFSNGLNQQGGEKVGPTLDDPDAE